MDTHKKISLTVLLAALDKVPKRNLAMIFRFFVSHVSGKKKEPKPKLLGPDIFGWGGGLPRKGVGAKRFGMSFETRGNQTFWWEIAGCWRDIPGVPEKFENQMFVFNFRPLSGTNMTGRPGYWTMEMIGGSSASYLARTPCVPLFTHCLIRVEAEGLLDYQGTAGIISIVRWNPRPVIFGVDPKMSLWRGPGILHESFSQQLHGFYGSDLASQRLAQKGLFQTEGPAVSANILERGKSGSFARGRCRRGRSEIPHFCSKLLLFALVP